MTTQLHPAQHITAATLLLMAGLAVVPATVARAQEGAGPAASQASPPAGEAGEQAARVAELEAEIARHVAYGEEWTARTAEFERARQDAPELLAAIEQEIAQLQRREPPVIAADATLDELETELLGAQQDLALARKEVSALEAEAAGRAERRKRVPALLTAAKERLIALASEAPAPPGGPALVEAQAKLARVRREAIEQEIAAYEEELRSYDARGQLLARRRERTALQVASQEARANTLQDAIAILRQGEAERAAEEAGRSLETIASLPPAVQELVVRLAEENRELALRRTGEEGLLPKIDDVGRKLARADERIAAVEATFERLTRKVRVGGLSGSVGLLLRTARSEAPDVGMYRRFIRMRQAQIAELQIQQVELAEQHEALADVASLIAQTLAEFDTALAPGDCSAIESLLRDLLETRRRYLEALLDDTETYFEKLVDFDARQQELIARTESLLYFIDERVLWMPSGEALPATLATDARDALAWLLTPRYWGQLPRALGSAAAAAPLLFAGIAILALAMPFAWPRLRAGVARLGQQASETNCIRIAPTGVALLVSLLLAVWGPALLALVGWQIGVSTNATQFVRCFAQGLLASAAVWLSLLLPRQLLRRRGIAEAHLGWAEGPTHDLRRHLGWLAWVAVPACFVIQVFEARGEGPWQQSVGRLVFLAVMAALLVFAHLVLREERGALRRAIGTRAEVAIPRWAWRLLYGGALLAVLGLAAAALRGYYWTALQLATSFHFTLLFLFLLLIAYELGVRWELLASRRLALVRFAEAREALAARSEAKPDGEVPEATEPELDIATVDAQTSRLLRNAALLAAVIGLWLIWADLLPAAGILRSVELWTTTTTATLETMNAAGEPVSTVEQLVVPVTLADLILALLAGAMTLVVARNLPGLLELSVFRQLRASPGERYAYTTIGKYTVTLAGGVLALNMVGVGWSKVQWLVAAVGLGLGFGLQEIFANFVSGLIILFERPIRVGDVVTVGDVNGRVTKIRIRATWITSFDRKELVVPNKEFITNQLVNWSLSDAVLRLDIPVGIAYGSDTDKAHRVLLEVAEKNEHVLKDPPPQAFFFGFGESSLDFELRVFSPDVEHRLGIVHDLHMEIDRAFRAEGIEIAFPQRDLHVRTLPVAPDLRDRT
jgi:potassium efflux system protein